MSQLIVYLWPAIVGGAGLVCLTSPLGTLLLWSRMAFLGDTLAHASLLGIALSFLWHLPLVFGVFLTSILIATLISYLQRHNSFGQDALLASLTYTLFAAGLIIMAITPAAPMNLLHYLYGDILLLNKIDIVFIWCFALLGLFVIYMTYEKMLLITISPEIAQVEGVPVNRYKVLLLLFLSLAVAFAIKFVGVLLVAALLVLPNLSARIFAHKPYQMMIGGVLCGLLSLVLGLILSVTLDWPTGPCIVVCAFALLVCSLLAHRLVQR